MVEELKGSEELRSSLPFGAINEIAETFGKTPAWVAQVIAGRKKGDLLIVECAFKISDVNYEIRDKIKEILKGYEKTN
tara:strand:+ start:20018 stop:20251 length:234 start_codon:yes stop_codon:yes gene_type:complete